MHQFRGALQRIVPAGQLFASAWTAVFVFAMAGDVQASDKTWGNNLGGTFSTPGNWQGGSVAGASDVAHFGISNPPSPFQFVYTVNFVTAIATPITNQALVVEDDFVTFDLNGRTYVTSLSSGNQIGNQLNRAASLSITDGTWSFPGFRRIDIGNSGGSGGLVVGSGGLITGLPFIFVGSSGTGTMSVIDGGDITYTSPGDGPLIGFGATGTVDVTGSGSSITGGSWSVGTIGTGTLNITAGGSVDSPAGANVEIGDLAGSTGTANVEGASSGWLSAVDMIVGSEGNGTLNVKSGGVVTGFAGRIGNSAGSTGMVTVKDTSSEWILSDDLYVGFSGTGTMSLESGATVNNIEGKIGAETGSHGTVHVTGPNVVWANFADLSVGDKGIGEMSITAGGGVSNADGHVGLEPGSVGTITVSGPGSGWASNGVLYVGELGMGTLSVENGGSVTSSSGFIANSANSTGTATVTGAGSMWSTNSGDIVVGFGGNGTLNVMAGGVVQNFDAVIAGSAGSQGTAHVHGAGSQWINAGDLIIGNDDHGTLIVEAGGAVSSSGPVGSAGGTIGDNPGSTGTVLVTGSGSQWTTNNTDLVVGREGTGDLTIEAGGSVSNRTGYVGRESSGSGHVTVTGAGSNWTNDFLVIGNAGAGTIEVTGGGTLVSHDALIEGAGGTVTVSGPGSSWSNANFLSVGHFDTGSLTIENGGLVAAARGFIGTGSPTSGTATVTGAGSAWTNSQVFVVGWQGQATLSILAGGSVSAVDAWIAGAAGSTGTVTVAGAGSRWNISGRLAIDDAFDPDELPAGGTGTLRIRPGGTVTVGGETALFPGATVSLEGGTLDTASVTFNGGGVFTFASGTLHVGTFNGSLVNQGGTLAPGHSPGSTNITGNYTQQPGSTLEIEIGGTMPGTEYDVVNIGGTATLGGKLSVAVINGFAPSFNDVFTVLGAGSLLNSFGAIANDERVTTSNGRGSFIVHYGPTSTFNPNQVVLTNFIMLGDYNRNGMVDAADYTVWRNSLGQAGPNLAADGNFDGMITRLDFNVWKSHYGQAAGSGSADVAPEPATWLMLSLLWASFGLRRWRGGRR